MTSRRPATEPRQSPRLADTPRSPAGDPARPRPAPSTCGLGLVRGLSFIALGLLVGVLFSLCAARSPSPQDLPPNAAPSPTGPVPLSAPADTPVYSYRIVNTYPHDRNAFTQGLVYTDGVLYEGTGIKGRSSLRKVELETGQVLQIHNLSSKYFGEGIAVYSDTIVQLTWQDKVAFVYDRDTFAQQGTFSYPTEGWGLTHDGQRLIMSDGTATLYFRDPQTFSQTGSVQVRDGTTPVTHLNELEYIRGQVYANVWLTDRIVRIDPQTGQVTAWIDLTGLRPSGADVLNGIAYDAPNDRLFVTGKLWPTLYEIELYLPNTMFLLRVEKHGAFHRRSPFP